MTLDDTINTLKSLMELWDEALQATIRTGYWKDTEDTERVIQEYGNAIADALREGKFSGDCDLALNKWLSVTAAESDYRREQATLVRSQIAPLDPEVWWVVLECAPTANEATVRAAYFAKMQGCHPDKVAHLAPQLQVMANNMAKALNKAWSKFLTRNV